MDNYYFIYIIKCLRVRPSRIESLCVCSIEMVLSVFLWISSCSLAAHFLFELLAVMGAV